MSFGARLRMIRKQRGLTQKDIAAYLESKNRKVSHVTVSKWERNMFTPDTETIRLLAEYLKVSTDFLLGNDNKDADDPSNIINLYDAIKKRPHVIDPKTGEIHYIPEERAKIIADILEGYLREKGILPEDNGDDCRSGTI